MNRFAQASYIPFVGWFLPMAVKGNGELAMSHAKQAFVTAAFFICVLIALFIALLFTPLSYHVFRLFLVLIIYAVYGLYFFLCGLGTYYVRKGKFVGFPYLKDFSDKLGF